VYDVQRSAGEGEGRGEGEGGGEGGGEGAPRAALSEVSLMACEEAGDACMSLDWSHEVSAPRLALCSTAGRLYLGALTGTGLRQLCSWQGHDLEGWAVAFDTADAHTLYSGADDATLKRWDLRCIDGGGSDDEEVAEPVGTASNRRSHGAGVCCISPHRTRPHLIATGSYDEKARLWDARNLRMPIDEIEVGGGVWRLKWHPEREDVLLAACMHAGFAVVRAAGLQTGADDAEQMTDVRLETVATYEAHGLGARGLGYGADWSRSRAAAEDGGTGESCPLLGATCSFYDRQLHLWRLVEG
jgi:diphthamide biosynthesis protein 7